MAVGIHSGDSWDNKMLIDVWFPSPKGKGSGRTELKWCCLEKPWQKCCCLPLLLCSLPSSPQPWPGAGAVSAWALLSITRTGPEHSICWACGKCSCSCLRASVGFWVTEKGVFCPVSHAITENLRFIVLWLPQLKCCPHGLHVLQMFRLLKLFQKFGVRDIQFILIIWPSSEQEERFGFFLL